MPARRFKQVDVFTSVPFRGNPVAVVLDADGLSPEEMQRIASWTNLSETTFVLPPTAPGADYRLRIFTGAGELPFAGHPTVGSAHAVLESGLVRPAGPCMVQECGAGLLDLRIETGETGRRIFVKVPPARVSALDADTVERIAAALGAALAPGVPPLQVNVGPVWLVAQLAQPEAIHTLKPDLAAVKRLSLDLNASGITAFTLTGTEPYPVYVRAFAPAHNVNEDPVCGSGNASVAAFLAHTRQLDRTGWAYTANQGLELGRNGIISVRVDPDGPSIEIGGAAVTCIDGTLRDRD